MRGYEAAAAASHNHVEPEANIFQHWLIACKSERACGRGQHNAAVCTSKTLQRHPPTSRPAPCKPHSFSLPKSPEATPQTAPQPMSYTQQPVATHDSVQAEADLLQHCAAELLLDGAEVPQPLSCVHQG